MEEFSIMSRTLPDEINEKRAENGKIYREAKAKGDYASAERALLASWSLFPEPKYDWDSTRMFLKTVSELYLEWGKYSDAEKWALNIFKSDLGPYDPMPYQLLGKIYLEAGQEELARTNLIKAFEMGGRRFFAGENPKYMKFIQEQLRK